MNHTIPTRLSLAAIITFFMTASTASAQGTADPFAQRLQGDGMTLELAGSAANGYRGTLGFRGKTYPAQARATGAKLNGSFRTARGDFAFSATLSGVNVELRSGTSRYRLTPARTDRRPGQVENPKGTVLLRRHSFRDPGFGGIESHTMYLPKDWKGKAGVQWTNSAFNYLHFVGSFEGPDQSSITFDNNQFLANSTCASTFAPMRAGILADRSGCSQIAWPPQQPGEVAVRYVIRRLRPGARNLQLVDVRSFPRAEAVKRELYTPLIWMLSPGHTMEFHVERALVTYELDGQQWEEFVQYVLVINKVSLRLQYVSWDSGATEISAVRTFRAPRGKLARRFPQMRRIADTLRPTPQWSLSLQKLQAEIAKIKHRGRMEGIRQFGKRMKSIAKTNAEISDIQMSTWRKTQASEDRVQKARINTIHEVHDYTSRDGSQLAVDNSYERVFEDGLGNLIMTNDANYEPGADSGLRTQDWSLLKRIDHLRR